MINGCSMIPAITTSTLTSTLPLQQNAWQDMLQNDSSLDLYNRPCLQQLIFTHRHLPISSTDSDYSPVPHKTSRTHFSPSPAKLSSAR